MLCATWFNKTAFGARRWPVNICIARASELPERDKLATREVQQQERSIQRGRLDKDLTPDELRALIILFFSLLDEQTRRLYAGIESLKLGENGDSKVAEFLSIDVKTVTRGRKQLLDQDIERDCVRKTGGGRIAVEKKRRR